MPDVGRCEEHKTKEDRRNRAVINDGQGSKRRARTPWRFPPGTVWPSHRVAGQRRSVRPEWEAAWGRELERRAAEADAHPEQGIPWPSARAELEAMLSQEP
jgi:Putative addiction module component